MLPLSGSPHIPDVRLPLPLDLRPPRRRKAQSLSQNARAAHIRRISANSFHLDSVGAREPELCCGFCECTPAVLQNAPILRHLVAPAHPSLASLQQNPRRTSSTATTAGRAVVETGNASHAAEPARPMASATACICVPLPVLAVRMPSSLKALQHYRVSSHRQPCLTPGGSIITGLGDGIQISRSHPPSRRPSVRARHVYVQRGLGIRI
ncbi:hypothetical protein OH77DRAFT_309787 [Trametes cingulata]|nr:hypothetical protein OH77DRAFT_309787 [Trametes cingulata]